MTRKLQKRIAELELDNTHQRRVSTIMQKEHETAKEKSNAHSIFGVTLKKNTNNFFMKQALEEDKEQQMRTKKLFADKEEELKKLHQCIENPSPKTVSSQCKNVI